MPLSIDVSIPYGNAFIHQVHQTPQVVEVQFSPAPHGGPETLWFCFRLRRDGQAPARTRIVLQNLQNLLGGGGNHSHIRPVIRTPRQDWHRLEPGAAAALPDGRVQLAWELETPADWLDIAVCFPYGRPEVQALLEELKGVYRCNTVGVSQQGRPLLRLSNDYGDTDPTRQRRGIYLIARQHSGETPGSWVLDGLLRALAELENPPLVWCIPLSNIDGVEQGDYGKDNFPWDLNRAWGRPPMRHATLVLQRDILRWRERCRPVAGLDFHAPGLCEADGAYIFHADEQARQAIAPLAEAIAGQLGPLALRGGILRSMSYPSRWPKATFAHFLADLNIPGLPIEIPYALFGDRLADRALYQQVGRLIAHALVAS